MEEIKEAVSHAVVKELEANRMLVVDSATALKALENQDSKDDCCNVINQTMKQLNMFKENLNKLKDPKVSDEEKKLLAPSMLEMQRGVKFLQNQADARDFSIFYAFYLGGQTVRNLTIQFEIDKGTVERIRKKMIQRLAVYLYPDRYITEILD